MNSWEEVHDFKYLLNEIEELKARLSLQGDTIELLIERIESVEFIGMDEGFATYVPRNRRNQ